MNKLFLLVAAAITLTFTGCKKEEVTSKHSQAEFVTDKMTVDVTPETKSFRIEVKFLNRVDRVDVRVDEIETTAKAGVHFLDESKADDFTLSRDDMSGYKDVVIYPENITEEVVIVYNKVRFPDEPADLINKLTVTLKPTSK
jgi:hypothetical protein